jgi:hypothetical protein
MGWKSLTLGKKPKEEKKGKGDRMPYDANKDQLLETWQNEETGLTISLYRYDDGEPKLQMGPRTYTRRDGTKRNTKTGRLSIADVLWLEEVWEDVKEKMNAYYLEES